MRNHSPNVDLGLRGERVGIGDHIAYLWETDDEFEEAVGFLATGLDEEDHCVVFGHDEANRKVLGILREEGYDPDRLRTEGRLSVLGGDTKAEEILSTIADEFRKAMDRGAELLRLLGNIGWGREGWPPHRELLEFEARVTDAASSFPSVVMCMYDVQALPGTLILHGAFETHPLTFCGNLVRENPHHVPIEEFLRRISHLDQADEQPGG